MSRTDEGEFELILGNKQLLSVFFIVVVLLGVFFTMGYIVGRNTAETTQAATTPAKPLVVEAGTVPGSPPAPQPQFSDNAPPPKEKPKPKPVEVAAVPKPSAPAPRAVAATPAPKPEPPSAPKPRVRQPPASPKPSRTASGEPKSGEVYLQVAATRAAEGGVLLDVLKKRGFVGRLAPVPDQDLVRVLVGPVEGPDALSRTRTALQSAGFKPFARRY